MAFKYYWEDFNVGDASPMGEVVMDKTDMIDFAKRYDPQPFHIDEAAAKESMFGGLIASGWQTCSLVMRMMVDSYLSESASLGSPGVDNVRWLKPVRPGDSLHVRVTVVDATRSRSKPDRGMVRTSIEAINFVHSCKLCLKPSDENPAPP